jgi:hypothetical protein
MFSKFHLKKLIWNKIPTLNTHIKKNFSAHANVAQEVSSSGENLSSRFHQIYLKELEKLEKSS